MAAPCSIIAATSPAAAAAMMGIDQPKVSALLNGRLANSSSARLMRFLTTLGQDVEIVVKAKPRTRARPHPGHC